MAYFRYPGLSRRNGLEHAVFSRLGGLSRPPFHSLNVSYAVGDRPECVRGNLRKVQEFLGAESVVYTHQAHGEEILILRKDRWKADEPVVTADAMITDAPGIALLIKQADCQAVILYDPEKKAAANVHCGWRGNVRNILGLVVSRMHDAFSCRPSNLLAAVGPSLGPCCAEFVDYKKIFPPSFRPFMVGENHFNLWAVSFQQLLDAGLKAENIELAGLCTRCRTDLFFSYRGEGKTGRFAAVAMLKG